MAEPFEIITVPDFSGRTRYRFEARTILFLASWMENAGAARSLPLHIACVGEPPESVRRMADRAGAIVTVHEHLSLGGAQGANKLRGLDVEPRATRYLLVDTDVVFLGDVSTIGDLPDCISAAPAAIARVPMHLWKRLYAGMGLDFPEERMAMIHSEVDMPPFRREQFEHQDRDTASSPPYYNSGVVFALWEYDLRSLWAECMELGFRIVDRSEVGADGIVRSDQAGLALSIASLRKQGVEFRRLPDGMHARWRHIYGGTPTPDEMQILHTTGMMNGLTSSGGFSSGHPKPLDKWLGQTRSRLLSQLRGDIRRGRPGIGIKRFRTARQRTEELRERFIEIYQNQIVGVA